MSPHRPSSRSAKGSSVICSRRSVRAALRSALHLLKASAIVADEYAEEEDDPGESQEWRKCAAEERGHLSVLRELYRRLGRRR